MYNAFAILRVVEYTAGLAPAVHGATRYRHAPRCDMLYGREGSGEAHIL